MFSSLVEPILPDLSGYQYFELASGSSCEVINSGMNVMPAITPDANTYGYYMNIYDRNTATSHNYLYYGGATKTNSYSCLVGTLNTSTNQCDISQCLVGTEIG